MAQMRTWEETSTTRHIFLGPHYLVGTRATGLLCKKSPRTSRNKRMNLDWHEVYVS